MKQTIWTLSLAGGLILSGCSGVESGTKQSSVATGTPPALQAVQEEDDDDDGDEEDIALNQLPKAVVSAVLAVVPGIVLQTAARVTSGGQVIYDVDGVAGSKQYCVEVSAEGVVLKVEQDDDDDDDEGDDDDDGEDDDR